MATRCHKHLSGSVSGRADIHVDVPRVSYSYLTNDRLGEPTEKTPHRVERARRAQRERFADGKVPCNADISPVEVREYCQVDTAGRSEMDSNERAFLSQRTEVWNGQNGGGHLATFCGSTHAAQRMCPVGDGDTSSTSTHPHRPFSTNVHSTCPADAHPHSDTTACPDRTRADRFRIRA